MIEVITPVCSDDVPLFVGGFIRSSDAVDPLSGGGACRLTVLVTEDLSSCHRAELEKSLQGSVWGDDFQIFVDPLIPRGHPHAVNEAFHWACRIKKAEGTKCWLFAEPDVTWLAEGACAGLLDQYEYAGTPVVGKLTARPGEGLHVNGVALYPPDMGEKVSGWPAVPSNLPFDFYWRGLILPLVYPTDSIYQSDPVVGFKLNPFEGSHYLIHHGCKDGSLAEHVMSTSSYDALASAPVPRPYGSPNAKSL